ncbi:MAG: permease, partial [bacterium]
METAIGIALSFWVTLGQMAPYLVMGFLAAGLLSVVISPGLIERHLGGRGPWPVVKASLFGVPLPLCSCSVIPVAMSLSRHGSTKGATTAFLLSTPQTGVDSMFATYSLLGPVFAVFRPV